MPERTAFDMAHFTRELSPNRCTVATTSLECLFLVFYQQGSAITEKKESSILPAPGCLVEASSYNDHILRQMFRCICYRPFNFASPSTAHSLTMTSLIPITVLTHRSDDSRSMRWLSIHQSDSFPSSNSSADNNDRLMPSLFSAFQS